MGRCGGTAKRSAVVLSRARPPRACFFGTLWRAPSRPPLPSLPPAQASVLAPSERAGAKPAWAAERGAGVCAPQTPPPPHWDTERRFGALFWCCARVSGLPAPKTHHTHLRHLPRALRVVDAAGGGRGKGGGGCERCDVGVLFSTNRFEHRHTPLPIPSRLHSPGTPTHRAQNTSPSELTRQTPTLRLYSSMKIHVSRGSS